MLRPHLPDEEVIEYEVYLEAGSDADAEAARMTSWVQQLCPFLSSYIWQRDAFALSAQSDEDKNGEDAKKSVCVCGRTRFGDNVSDEWLVVFLVRELSRAFPSCVFRVCDGDGELLLVEAALALPDWVEPDTAQGRVFFFRGEMQLLGVPEEEENEEQPYAPAHVRSVAHAAEIVRRFGPLGLTRASDAVQQCIENRLAEMPQKALIENYHWCRLRLPRELARLLQYRPQIVARAVEAFYYREAEDDARLRNLNRFDVSSSVVVRVRFSRFLFVQLLQQTFPIPSARFSLPAENDPLRKAFELGMKLTCGFELLWSNDAGREELQHDLEKLSGTELLVGGKDASEPDSDESWMLISPEELDDMMAPREAEVEQVKQMMDKVEGIKSFLNQESSMDGAEADFESMNGGDRDLFDVKKFMLALGMREEEFQDEDMIDQQDLMDEELRNYGRDSDYGNDEDTNLVESIIKGYEAAGGDAGPMSNLLSQLKQRK